MPEQVQQDNSDYLKKLEEVEKTRAYLQSEIEKVGIKSRELDGRENEVKQSENLISTIKRLGLSTEDAVKKLSTQYQQGESQDLQGANTMQMQTQEVQGDNTNVPDIKNHPVVKAMSKKLDEANSRITNLTFNKEKQDFLENINIELGKNYNRFPRIENLIRKKDYRDFVFNDVLRQMNNHYAQNKNNPNFKQMTLAEALVATEKQYNLQYDALSTSYEKGLFQKEQQKMFPTVHKGVDPNPNWQKRQVQPPQAMQPSQTMQAQPAVQQQEVQSQQLNTSQSVTPQNPQQQNYPVQQQNQRPDSRVNSIGASRDNAIYNEMGNFFGPGSQT